MDFILVRFHLARTTLNLTSYLVSKKSRFVKQAPGDQQDFHFILKFFMVHC